MRYKTTNKQFEGKPPGQKERIAFESDEVAVSSPERLERKERIGLATHVADLPGDPPVDSMVPLPWEQPQQVPEIEPSNEPPTHTSNVRQRVRHSFDVYADQLLSLREIALAREAHLGQRVRLGDVVQEALDNFIRAERGRTSGGRNRTEMTPEETHVEVRVDSLSHSPGTQGGSP